MYNNDAEEDDSKFANFMFVDFDMYDAQIEELEYRINFYANRNNKEKLEENQLMLEQLEEQCDVIKRQLMQEKLLRRERNRAIEKKRREEYVLQQGAKHELEKAPAIRMDYNLDSRYEDTAGTISPLRRGVGSEFENVRTYQQEKVNENYSSGFISNRYSSHVQSQNRFEESPVVLPLARKEDFIRNADYSREVELTKQYFASQHQEARPIPTSTTSIKKTPVAFGGRSSTAGSGSVGIGAGAAAGASSVDTQERKVTPAQSTSHVIPPNLLSFSSLMLLDNQALLGMGKVRIEPDLPGFNFKSKSYQSPKYFYWFVTYLRTFRVLRSRGSENRIKERREFLCNEDGRSFVPVADGGFPVWFKEEITNMSNQHPEMTMDNIINAIEHKYPDRFYKAEYGKDPTSLRWIHELPNIYKEILPVSEQQVHGRSTSGSTEKSTVGSSRYHPYVGSFNPPATSFAYTPAVSSSSSSFAVPPPVQVVDRSHGMLEGEEAALINQEQEEILKKAADDAALEDAYLRQSEYYDEQDELEKSLASARKRKHSAITPQSYSPKVDAVPSTKLAAAAKKKATAAASDLHMSLRAKSKPRNQG